jgi:divalent metal cation (Fe/Co/Zn/Cd) transporter
MIAALILPLMAFIRLIITRIFYWFFTAYWAGALKSILIYFLLFTAIATGITMLITTANAMLLDAIRSMSPMSQLMLAPIASMMPPSLSICAGMIASVYILGVAYNLAKEVAKLKARAAEKALGFFKA